MSTIDSSQLDYTNEDINHQNFTNKTLTIENNQEMNENNISTDKPKICQLILI